MIQTEIETEMLRVEREAFERIRAKMAAMQCGGDFGPPPGVERLRVFLQWFAAAFVFVLVAS